MTPRKSPLMQWRFLSAEDRSKQVRYAELLGQAEEKLKAAADGLKSFTPSPNMLEVVTKANLASRSAKDALDLAKSALTQAGGRIFKSEEERDLPALIGPWEKLARKIPASPGMMDQWTLEGLADEARQLRAAQAASRTSRQKN